MFTRKLMAVARSSAANAVGAWATSRSLRAIAQQWPCPECNAIRPTRQSLTVHMCKKHKIRRPERMIVHGTICEICRLQFHTRTRLLNHICEKSQLCCDLLWELRPLEEYHSENAARALDDAERTRIAEYRREGHRGHKAKQLAFRVPGPLHPVLLRAPADKWPIWSNGQRLMTAS